MEVLKQLLKKVKSRSLTGPGTTPELKDDAEQMANMERLQLCKDAYAAKFGKARARFSFQCRAVEENGTMKADEGADSILKAALANALGVDAASRDDAAGPTRADGGSGKAEGYPNVSKPSGEASGATAQPTTITSAASDLQRSGNACEESARHRATPSAATAAAPMNRPAASPRGRQAKPRTARNASHPPGYSSAGSRRSRSPQGRCGGRRQHQRSHSPPHRRDDSRWRRRSSSPFRRRGGGSSSPHRRRYRRSRSTSPRRTDGGRRSPPSRGRRSQSPPRQGGGYQRDDDSDDGSRSPLRRRSPPKRSAPSSSGCPKPLQQESDGDKADEATSQDDGHATIAVVEAVKRSKAPIAGLASRQTAEPTATVTTSLTAAGTAAPTNEVANGGDAGYTAKTKGKNRRDRDEVWKKVICTETGKSSYVSESGTTADYVPLSEFLKWQKCSSSTRGIPFYYNIDTKERRWEPPLLQSCKFFLQGGQGGCTRKKCPFPHRHGEKTTLNLQEAVQQRSKYPSVQAQTTLHREVENLEGTGQTNAVGLGYSSLGALEGAAASVFSKYNKQDAKRTKKNWLQVFNKMGEDAIIRRFYTNTRATLSKGGSNARWFKNINFQGLKTAMDEVATAKQVFFFIQLDDLAKAMAAKAIEIPGPIRAIVNSSVERFSHSVYGVVCEQNGNGSRKRLCLVKIIAKGVKRFGKFNAEVKLLTNGTFRPSKKSMEDSVATMPHGSRIDDEIGKTLLKEAWQQEISSSSARSSDVDRSTILLDEGAAPSGPVKANSPTKMTTLKRKSSEGPESTPKQSREHRDEGASVENATDTTPAEVYALKEAQCGDSDDDEAAALALLADTPEEAQLRAERMLSLKAAQLRATDSNASLLLDASSDEDMVDTDDDDIAAALQSMVKDLDKEDEIAATAKKTAAMVGLADKAEGFEERPENAYETENHARLVFSLGHGNNPESMLSNLAVLEDNREITWLGAKVTRVETAYQMSKDAQNVKLKSTLLAADRNKTSSGGFNVKRAGNDTGNYPLVIEPVAGGGGLSGNQGSRQTSGGGNGLNAIFVQ